MMRTNRPCWWSRRTAVATGSPISGPGLTSTVAACADPGRNGPGGVAEGTVPACGAGPGPIALRM